MGAPSPSIAGHRAKQGGCVAVVVAAAFSMVGPREIEAGCGNLKSLLPLSELFVAAHMYLEEEYLTDQTLSHSLSFN